MSATVEQIKKVVNGVKQDVYPITKTSAVTDNDGNNVDTLLIAKQDKLVSGENIKTINGDSILTSGNLDLASVEDVSTKADKVVGMTSVTTGDLAALDASGNLTDSTYSINHVQDASDTFVTTTVVNVVEAGNGNAVTSGAVWNAINGAGTPVTDAPEDGNMYIRTNGRWVKVEIHPVEYETMDGSTYIKNNIVLAE